MTDDDDDYDHDDDDDDDESPTCYGIGVPSSGSFSDHRKTSPTC